MHWFRVFVCFFWFCLMFSELLGFIDRYLSLKELLAIISSHFFSPFFSFLFLRFQFVCWPLLWSHSCWMHYTSAHPISLCISDWIISNNPFFNYWILIWTYWWAHQRYVNMSLISNISVWYFLMIFTSAEITCLILHAVFHVHCSLYMCIYLI